MGHKWSSSKSSSHSRKRRHSKRKDGKGKARQGEDKETETETEAARLPEPPTHSCLYHCFQCTDTSCLERPLTNHHEYALRLRWSQLHIDAIRDTCRTLKQQIPEEIVTIIVSFVVDHLQSTRSSHKDKDKDKDKQGWLWTYDHSHVMCACNLLRACDISNEFALCLHFCEQALPDFAKTMNARTRKHKSTSLLMSHARNKLHAHIT